MKKQIKIYDQNDPLNDEIITLDVPKGINILSNEKYTRELFNRFMKSLDAMSYVEPMDGALTKAKVISIDKNTANIEINSKHTGLINLTKENKEYKDYIKVGNEIYVKLNRVEGSIDGFSASFTDAVKDNKFTELMNSIGKLVAYKATVKELIHGGYNLLIDGILVFMPGSLAGMNKLWDFESLVGKEIIVMAINYEKEMIIVSRRAYLRTLVAEEIEKLKESMKDEKEGSVTGTSKYGIFVEFGNDCLTGLIPTVELNDEWSQKFNAGLVKAGMRIKFFTKDIINEYKIILTQNRDNPWDNIEEKIKPQMKIKGKISSILKYGAFIEIEKGIVGLLHSSEFDINEYKDNDEIDVIITKIDKENKKINLIKYRGE